MEDVKTSGKDIEVEGDEALATLASAGSRAAFFELYQRYSTRIRSMAARMTGDEHVANDLTQDVFARAWTSLDSFDPSRKFAPWLFAIATHRIVDELKRRRRWKPAPEDDTLPDRAPRPEIVVLRREEVGLLREALGRVPAPLRIVLILTLQEQQSPEEVAESLGISVNLARVRLCRGLRTLQGVLAP